MAIHHAEAASLFVVFSVFPLFDEIAQDLVNLAKLVAQLFDALFQMMKPLTVVVLGVFMIIVVRFFVQRPFDVLGQFVGLSFDVLGRFVEASFVQMADGLMQQFQATMSVFSASTMLVPAMFVMSFVFVRFSVLKEFPQFSFDSFRTLRLTGFTQFGKVMPVSLDFDFQSKTSHTSLDLAFDSFRFFGVSSFTKFGSLATHRFDVFLKLFVLRSAIAIAFPFFPLGEFSILTPFAVPFPLFSFLTFLCGDCLITFSLDIVLSTDGQQHSTNTAGNRGCQEHSTKGHGLSPD